MLFLFSFFCFGKTDLNGKWFVYLEKNGVIVFRANYDCIIIVGRPQISRDLAILAKKFKYE